MYPRVFSIKVISYVVLLYVLDVTVMPFVAVGIFKPSLLYLMILYAAFRWHWKKIIPMGILVGLLRDFMSSTYWGIETGILVLSSYALCLFVQKIERYSLLMRITTAFIFILTVLFLNLIAGGLAEGLTEISWNILLNAFGMAVASAFVMPLFFFLSALWFRDRSRLKQYELF